MAAGHLPATDFGVRVEAARRLRLLVRLVLLWAAILILRLFYLQIVQHDQYLHQALSQQGKTLDIKPSRGTILDRNGRRLAMSLPVDSVYVNPLQLKNPDVASSILGDFLQLDKAELAGRIRSAVAANKGFLWVKRKITPEEAQRLRALKFEWIGIAAESRRYYPFETLAAHILGGVNPDDDGIDGIEAKLNEDLAGSPGSVRLSTDVQQRSFASEVIGTPAQPGRDLRLTIDSRIQYIAEQALKKAIIAHHCKDGSVIVMDPNTGDILALANYPTYDPNVPPKHGDDKAARLNLAVSVPFEPGSVFKIVTVSSALETTNLRPETIINCGGGQMTLFGRVIHDDRSDRYASLSMADVLAHSSNIGAINIGLKVGKENLYKYIKAFGFGSKPGLPLSGESAGMVHSLPRWQATSIGSVAMGHEVSVTVLQLAQACSTIANGGFRVKPHLLTNEPKEQGERVIRPETAILMRQMMEGVNLRGTGRLYAQIPGYTSGGKTGTAQMVDPDTGKYTNFNNASYMGFAPVANPRIVVVVCAHGSSGVEGHGAQVAAPVFSTVAGATLRILEIPQDLPETLPVVNASAKTDVDDMAIADLGQSSSSVPLPLASEEASFDDASFGGRRTFLETAQSDRSIGPTVPDFTNKTMREVIETSNRLGIPVDFTGNGLARAQFPVSGSSLASGQHVQVRFGR